MEPESGLVQHARQELQRAGLFDKDSDYGGMLGDAVMKMVKAFAAEGHSGNSAHMALAIFNRVASWKTLTPITSDPREWMVIDVGPGEKVTWQNRRDPSMFSMDGGKTAYSVDDPKREVKPCQSAE